MKFVRLLLFFVLNASLLGCASGLGFPGVYRINVEQGNIVTEDMIAQLKEGMSRRQVRFIMGTPLIEDTFNADRWDYRYMLVNGDQTLRQWRIGVVFKDDELVDVEGDMKPVWAGGTAGAPKEDPEDTPAEPEESGTAN